MKTTSKTSKSPPKSKARAKKPSEPRDRVQERKERFLIAYEQAMAIVSTACRAVGISRGTFYYWMREDTEFAERIREVDEGQIDAVEGALLSRIQECDTTAIIFYLKTKGKARGYSERLELTGKDGGELLPPRVLTKEEAKVLFAQLESDY